MSFSLFILTALNRLWIPQWDSIPQLVRIHKETHSQKKKKSRKYKVSLVVKEEEKGTEVKTIISKNK